MLTYAEAMLFVRFGEDMRLPSWPPGHFVRLAPIDQQIPGFVGQPYNPTAAELAAQTWSKA